MSRRFLFIAAVTLVAVLTATLVDVRPATARGNGASKVVFPIKGERGGNSFGQMGYGRTVPHKGIDFGAGCGTPVRAAMSGTLKKEKGHAWAGTYLVTIKAKSGTVTKYAHMQSFSVASGSTVKAGQKIGTVGKRGNARGCHLHFEVVVNGKTINPRPWLDRHVGH